MCLDLQHIITMGINPNISDYTILGFAFVTYQSELAFYIDEVSFSQYQRIVPQVRMLNIISQVRSPGVINACSMYQKLPVLRSES